MYKVCSIFSQVLKLFSRGEFEKAVKEHKAERHARGFTSWGQFMAMLFCQLGRAHSLREICGGLACCEGQLKHLGVPVAPRKSTLAYANENRPWELYQTVCQEEMQPLNDFVDRVLENEWGPYSKDDILDLLREIEGQMLSNIQVKAMEGPRFAGMADEVSEQTQREFETLIARVEQAFAARDYPAG